MSSIFRCRFVFCSSLSLVVFYCLFFLGCNKDLIEKQSSEISLLKSKVDSLNQIVVAQSNELKKLKETDQGFFTKGIDFLKAGNFEEAKTSFSEVVKRFPNSGLVSQAQVHLKEINSKIALSLINQIESSLSVSDKSSYESAAEKLSDILSQTISNEPRSKANSLLAKVKKMLASWPISFSDLKQMQLRFTDLIGKKISISDVYIEGDDYYNYNFDDNYEWQSFRIKKGGEDIHVYAPKRSKLATSLLDKYGSGGSSSNIVITYPYGTRDGSVARILSCDY